MFTDSKPHYLLLDGLRGVAALIVIVYHVFECFDWSPVPHGYLAVDFFFVLSGFVIGYAYDSRWQEGLSVARFFKRRLIRLHPMVILGALIGAVCFLIQGSVRWDGTPVSIGWVMIAMLLGMLMLPLYPGASADVRGNGELFPPARKCAHRRSHVRFGDHSHRGGAARFEYRARYRSRVRFGTVRVDPRKRL